MVTFEQIKLLESTITRAIDVVTRLSEENVRLKKRNGELEELAERLKNEKTRIEEGIVSALDRLNQFEDAIERSLDSVKGTKSPEPSPPLPARPELRVSGEQASAAFRKPSGIEPPEPAPSIPAPSVPAAAPAGQTVPRVYLVDEEETESGKEEDEDASEAELDIF
jgi:hypothetical protein